MTPTAGTPSSFSMKRCMTTKSEGVMECFQAELGFKYKKTSFTTLWVGLN